MQLATAVAHVASGKEVANTNAHTAAAVLSAFLSQHNATIVSTCSRASICLSVRVLCVHNQSFSFAADDDDDSFWHQQRRDHYTLPLHVRSGIRVSIQDRSYPCRRFVQQKPTIPTHPSRRSSPSLVLLEH